MLLNICNVFWSASSGFSLQVCLIMFHNVCVVHHEVLDLRRKHTSTHQFFPFSLRLPYAASLRVTYRLQLFLCVVDVQTAYSNHPAGHFEEVKGRVRDLAQLQRFLCSRFLNLVPLPFLWKHTRHLSFSRNVFSFAS